MSSAASEPAQPGRAAALHPAPPIAAARAYFANHRYAVLRGVLGAAESATLAQYALLQATQPGYFADESALSARGRYADAMTESLLMRMQPLMEAVEGAPLHPCYSFLRIYQHDAELPAHRDRPSCEISTSITLGFRDADRWPICVDGGGAVAIDLAPGDMLVYRGAEVAHWRDRFAGGLWVQAFLHYVRADGPHAQCRFDGREALGPFDGAHHARQLPAGFAGSAGATE